LDLLDHTQQGGQHRELVGWVRPAWVQQAIKFSVVGLLNTALDAALYLVLTHWLGFGGFRILAKGISYAAGVANSFCWNRSWTFHSRAGMRATFFPFVMVNLAALAVNAATMYLGLRLFNQSELLALAMATGVTLVWNFGASKTLVFKR